MRTPIALAALALAASAHAAANCDEYARAAVADQARNVALGCGYGGARWSADPGGHRRWCEGARQSSVDAEAAERRNGLGNCEYCARYADEAAAAQARNVANGCNLRGPRWSADRNVHFPWCMSARRESVEREANARNAEAGKCEECTRYARAAVDAQARNVANACGFAGPPWNGDFGAHYGWCWNLGTRGALGSEARKRDDLLRVCAASAARRPECDRYARLAVAQNRENRERRCGLRGERWHDSYQDHYGWCLAKPASEVASHQNGREAELARCRGAQNPSNPPPSEACAVSVVVANDRCLNADGSASFREPGTSSATGCGSTVERARERAIASFQATFGQCVTAEPQNGCCTVTERVAQGCLCQ